MKAKEDLAQRMGLGKYAPLAGKLLLVGAADRHWQ